MSESLLDRGTPNDMDRQGEIPQIALHAPGRNPIGSTDNKGTYLSMIPPDDLGMDLNLSYLESSAPLSSQANNQDPYLDDDVLQEEYSANFQRQVPRSMVADHIRSVYSKSTYGNVGKGLREGSPFLEGSSYSNLSNRSSVDFSSSYPESHSVPRAVNSPHPPYNPRLSEEAGDDGLFIESMPAIANDNYVNRMYGGPSLDVDDSFSPRPFDLSQQYPFYPEGDPINPDLRRNVGGSMGFFRDGGVGIGARSYHRSLINEPDGWARSRSLSRNMDSMGGYGLGQVSHASYNSLRPSSIQHASQNTLNDMGLGMEYGSLHDLSFSGKVTPHHVASFEHIPTDYGTNHGYLGRRDMPTNRSYMDSLGLLEESELPMARAKSMMYLGEEDDIDYGSSMPYDGYYLASQSRLQESTLSQENLPPLQKNRADPPSKPESKAESKVESKGESKSESKTESKTEPKESRKETVSEMKTPKLDPNSKPADALTPSPAESATEPKTDPSYEKREQKDSKQSRGSTSPNPEWHYRTSRSPQPFSEQSKSPRPQLYQERSKSPFSERSKSPKPSQSYHERSKSPRSPSEGDRARVMVHGKYRFACRDFEKGVCSRGAACKFYHDPAKGRVCEVV